MTLDQLLGNLTTTENGKRTIGPKYDSGYLVDTIENLAELDETNTMTPEGLKTYSKLTGDNKSKYSNEIELRKNAISNLGNKDLSMYVDKHFSEIINELSNEERLGMSFKYCPENEIEVSDKQYNAAVTIIKSAKKELEEISKDPRKYISTQLKDESEIMKHYISMFAKEFLQIQQENAQISATRAIAKYEGGNSGKFLKTTKQHLDIQNSKVMEKQGEFEKYMRSTGNEKRALYATEFAEAINDKVKEIKEMTTKYSDVQTRKPCIQEAVTLAVQRIKETRGDSPSPIKLSSLVGQTHDLSSITKKEAGAEKTAENNSEKNKAEQPSAPKNKTNKTKTQEKSSPNSPKQSPNATKKTTSQTNTKPNATKDTAIQSNSKSSTTENTATQNDSKSSTKNKSNQGNSQETKENNANTQSKPNNTREETEN